MNATKQGAKPRENCAAHESVVTFPNTEKLGEVTIAL